jgi:hypothetical protein
VNIAKNGKFTASEKTCWSNNNPHPTTVPSIAAYCFLPKKYRFQYSGGFGNDGVVGLIAEDSG